nr:MAG TPA: hypothetical protein [Caudoviricetes sp.]
MLKIAAFYKGETERHNDTYLVSAANITNSLN